MSRFLSATAALLLVTAGPTFAQQNQGPQSIPQHPTQTKSTHRLATAAKRQPAKAVKPVVPEPVAVAPAPQPPAPLRPSQMPPEPPFVQYRDGKLTIITVNSTLTDILNAVRSETGATAEIPPGPAGERVAIHVGPASARDVVSALLDGSPFNYILIGTENDPVALRRIIVSPRQGGGIPAGNSSPAAQSPVSSFQRSPLPGMNASPTPEPTPTPDQPDDAAQQSAPRVMQPMPGMAPAPPFPGAVIPGAPLATSPEGGQAAGQKSPGVVKTPEELLDELKKMQQPKQP